MIDKSWLRNMLTPSKQKSPMWVDLVDAITDALNTFPEKYLDRLKTRISLFEQSGEELSIELKELGDNFAYGDVNEKNLPLIIMQREDEFHFKSTEYTLASTLAREFSGINIQWKRLFAPKDLETIPYCEKLIIDKQFDIGFQDKDDFFLTSRGLIYIPLQELREVGTTEEDIVAFEFHLRRVAHPLVPLHIVLEGYLYYFNIYLDELPETIDFELISKTEVDIPEIEEQITYETKPTLEPIYIDEGLRSPAPADMRDGPVGVDHIALDFEAYMEYVNRVPTLVTVTPDTYVLISGQSVQLSCEINYEGGFVDSYARWFSEDNDIATVDSNGVVTGEWTKGGSVAINAESVIDSSVKGAAIITVHVPDLLLNPGYNTSTKSIGFGGTFGSLTPREWQHIDPDIDPAGTVDILRYINSTSSNKVEFYSNYRSYKWNDYDCLRFRFIDVDGVNHYSKIIPWANVRQGYVIKGAEYDKETFDWLYERAGTDIGIFVEEQEFPSDTDFILYPGLGASSSCGAKENNEGCLVREDWVNEAGEVSIINTIRFHANFSYSIFFIGSTKEKWKGYDNISFEFTDIDSGEVQESKIVPWDIASGEYRVLGKNYDLTVFNWLYKRQNKEIRVKVKEEIIPPEADFLLFPGVANYYSGYGQGAEGFIIANNWETSDGSDDTVNMLRFYKSYGIGSIFKSNNANKWQDFDYVKIKMTDEDGETVISKTIPYTGPSTGYRVNIKDYDADIRDWLVYRKETQIIVEVIGVTVPEGTDFILIPESDGNRFNGYDNLRGAILNDGWKHSTLNDTTNATIKKFMFYADYGTGAEFVSTSNDNKWRELNNVKFLLTDLDGNTHETKPLPFLSGSSGYRVNETDYDMDTWNWLDARSGQDIFVTVLDGTVYDPTKIYDNKPFNDSDPVMDGDAS